MKERCGPLAGRARSSPNCPRRAKAPSARPGTRSTAPHSSMTRTRACSGCPRMARAELESLRKFALGLPGTEESVACAGTVLEKRTVKAGGKAFLFVGAKDLMLKLGESLPEARKLAKEDPERCKAGAGGWVTLRIESSLPLPGARLRAWVAES